MSMPCFPPDGAGVSRCQALTMIIASIAMEELALSRIMDAEGEKLNRLLGDPCIDIQGVLAANLSVTALLEAIQKNQALLKGKLEAVLAVDCPCEPPCPPPCPPVCRPCAGPCGPCRFCTASCRPHPPCGGAHVRLTSGALTWECGSAMTWEQAEQSGGPSWSDHAPAQVQLDPRRAYLFRYTFRISSVSERPEPCWISLRTEPAGQFSALQPRCFSRRELRREPVVLSDSGVLLPQAEVEEQTVLSVQLSSGGPLQVEQAELWVEEFF